MARLLLVEDDPLLVDGMEPVLEHQGYEVHLARDANEALQALGGETHFDLIILDVMLPLKGAFDDGVGGLEAGIEILRRIREADGLAHRRDLPVLCYTVRGVTPRIRDALEALGGVVIAKGVDPEVVLDEIREMLSQEEG